MNRTSWGAAASLALCAVLWPNMASAEQIWFQSQPSDVMATPGQDARFDAESALDNTSQWQVSSDNGLTWQNLPGPHFAHLVLPAVTLADNGKQYRRRIFRSSEVVVSRAARLTVQTSTTRKLSLLAGAVGGGGSPVDNIAGSNLRFSELGWLSTDSAGNVFAGHKGIVRKIDSSRRAQSLAGRTPPMGSKDGRAGAASFLELRGSVVAPNGDVYITDDNQVRKITSDGTVTTLAGGPDAGHADGKGQAARFNQPTGIARDEAGYLYVADTGNHTIRKITPVGVVSTLAGKAGLPGTGGTTVDDARFNGPKGVAVGPGGLVYVTDTENEVIRRISPAGFVAKIAGEYGVRGTDPGHFCRPHGLAVNSANEIFVADWCNGVIRKIVAGTVTTLAGTPGLHGANDGTGGNARFNQPVGLAFDRSGALFVGDSRTIRKVSMTGVVTTWAGRAGEDGTDDGTGAQARFAMSEGLSIDADGNIYVSGYPGVRKVTSAGVVSTFDLSAYTSGVAVDASGNLLSADQGQCVIRRTTPAHVTTIIAGEPWDCRHVNGHGTNARFAYPSNITLDAEGNIFVSDRYTIRKITPSHDVTRYAGSPTQEPVRDGTVNTARFARPKGLIFDSAGNLFVADGTSVRKITPSGIVSTLAGSQLRGLADGQGSEARFTYLTGLTIDASGNLYAADAGGGDAFAGGWELGANAIRKITPTGAVTTVLGTRAMATTVLGTNPLVNDPQGVVMIDANHLAISSENAILIYTLP